MPLYSFLPPPKISPPAFAAPFRRLVLMSESFASVVAHVVSFPNHYTGGESACTVYVALAPDR